MNRSRHIFRWILPMAAVVFWNDFGFWGIVGAYLFGVLIDRMFFPIQNATGGGWNSLFGNAREMQAVAERTLRESVLGLIACVMKADGRVTKEEVASIKPFLLRQYGEQGALEALQTLKQMLALDFRPEDFTSRILTITTYETRLTIVHLLLTLAHSDGNFDPAEQQIIRTIAAGLQISSHDYEQLLALFHEQVKDDSWAYAALGIEKSATDEEVKKAYREMAKKYHPDRVAASNPELVQSATEKFKQIKEAYDTIQKSRGK